MKRLLPILLLSASCLTAKGQNTNVGKIQFFGWSSATQIFLNGTSLGISQQFVIVLNQPITYPTTPQNVAVTAYTSNSVSLVWNASTATNGSQIVKYSILYINSFLGAGPPQTITAFSTFGGATNATNFVVTGLAPNSVYCFSIYATDSSNNYSIFSTPICAQTSNNIAPAITNTWAQAFGGTGSDAGLGVAVDQANSSIVLAGAFQGVANFGGVNISGASVLNILLAKYSYQGVHQFSKSVATGTGGGLSTSVFVDNPTSNIFLTGYFQGSLNFGTTNLAATAGTIDIYVAKFNSTGVCQWAANYDSAGQSPPTQQGNCITVDTNGNPWIGGLFGGTINFGSTNLASASGHAFIAKLDGKNGTNLFARQFGGPNSGDTVEGIALDTSNNVVITGAFNSGSLAQNFGCSTMLSSNLTADVFLGKYDLTGRCVWVQSFGTKTGNEDTPQYGANVAIDSNGNVFVIGTFGDPGGGNMTIASTVLTNIGNNPNVFFAKFNSAGTLQWAKSFGGATGASYGKGIITDTSGNVIITGSVNSPVNFGGGIVTPTGYAAYIAKFTSAGTFTWANVYSSASAFDTDTGVSVATDNSGFVIGCGNFTTTGTGGSFAAPGTNFVSRGGSDVYLFKVAP